MSFTESILLEGRETVKLLQSIADVAQELDLLVISDEVYEHYVTGEHPHIPIATLPGMWERTITVNSFSKSWNISGWRLGYAYGKGELIAPLNNAANVIYVCPATPLQAALSRTPMQKAGVGMTPSSAFANSDDWDAHVRICIAREDSILDGAMEKLRAVLR